MLAPDGQAACIFKVTGAPKATFGIATAVAAAAPVTAAALKNLRLEGVFPFLRFLSLILLFPLLFSYNFHNLSINDY
tara:strand:+ start:169 stop:399 length:231 start_codon:yes stop_codon:yes gene_type:complete